MKRIDYLGIVPEQAIGKEIEAIASVTLTNVEEAKSFFRIVKARMVQVEKWHSMAGWMSAEFQLTDEHGEAISRMLRKGDFLRIDIPGPGSKEGDGYDWARVEDVRSMEDSLREGFGFRVRPCQNPVSEKNETAHFYDDTASGSFIIMRENSVVTAWIVDRNIQPNTEPVSLIDKIRDSVVGMSALIKFSEIQWQHLVKGLLKANQ